MSVRVEAAPSDTRWAVRPLAVGWLLALGVGAAFRLFEYLANRSLWLDEALMVPLVERPWAEVLDPRVTGPTPLGFVWLTKGVVAIAGSSEWALRLVPLLAGLAGLGLVAVLARRLLPPWGALAAVAFVAVAPYPIYYSSEVKHYSVDLAAAAAALLGVWEARRTRLWVGRPRRALGAAVAAGALVLVSYTAVLVFAGALGVLVVQALRWRDRTLLRRALVAWSPWVVGSVAAAVALRTVLRVPYLEAFWQGGFWPLPPDSLREALWLPRALFWAMREPLGLLLLDDTVWGRWVLPVALLISIGVGLIGLRRQERGAEAALLLGPLAAGLAAAALRLYPFGGSWQTAGRALMYLVPSFALLIGAGIETVGRALAAATRRVAGPRWARVGAVGGGMGAAALAIGPALAEDLIAIPYARAEWRPIVAYVAAHRRPDERIFVHYDAAPMLRYYAPRFGLPSSALIWGRCARARPADYVRQLEALRGRRVWVLIGGGVGARNFPEKELLLAYLESRGTRLDDRWAIGATAYLYDLGRPRAPFRAIVARVPVRADESCALWAPFTGSSP